MGRSSCAAGKQVKAIRIRPAIDLKHPLVIRQITLESEPTVAVFKYPVEVFVNVADAREMKDWAEKAARICEQQYPTICGTSPATGSSRRTRLG